MFGVWNLEFLQSGLAAMNLTVTPKSGTFFTYVILDSPNRNLRFLLSRGALCSNHTSFCDISVLAYCQGYLGSQSCNQPNSNISPSENGIESDAGSSKDIKATFSKNDFPSCLEPCIFSRPHSSSFSQQLHQQPRSNVRLQQVLMKA